MTISTETLGLAGEYAVAFELCRRGQYCQLTLGNRKKTDLIVDTNDQLWRVSVKSKQKKGWPSIKGIWQPTDLLVFVDFEGKELIERPDFYVLQVTDWVIVMNKKQKDGDPRAKLDKENTLYWPGEEGEKNAWTGCQILPSDIALFKDKWPF